LLSFSIAIYNGKRAARNARKDALLYQLADLLRRWRDTLVEKGKYDPVGMEHFDELTEFEDTLTPLFRGLARFQDCDDLVESAEAFHQFALTIYKPPIRDTKQPASEDQVQALDEKCTTARNAVLERLDHE
jgi:hypothetical protein